MIKTEQVKFLLEHKISFEEFNFLQSLLQIQETPSDVPFIEACTEYYTFKERPESFYNIIMHLEALDFIETFPNYIIHSEVYKLNLSKVRVTDTYKALFYTDDKEGSFREFIEIFGKSFDINGQRVSTLNPEKGESFEDLEDRYWKLVENGNLKKIKAVHSNTANYAKFIGTNMNISKYLLGYKGYMLTLEETLNEINRLK